jgi:hypothetical protein
MVDANHLTRADVTGFSLQSSNLCRSAAEAFSSNEGHAEHESYTR